jgi:hypothetical protein
MKHNFLPFVLSAVALSVRADTANPEAVWDTVSIVITTITAY